MTTILPSHYWKRDLCRVSKIGHSAKTFFAKCCTRQKRALGKGLLCRVPGCRQKRGTRHRLPRVTVFGHVLFRVPAVRHSAKIFFLENTLPSAPDTALGKDSIFFLKCLCRVPTDSTLGKDRNLKNYFFLKYLCRVPLWRHSAKRKFLKKFKKPLCRASYSWYSAKTPSVECHALALGKVFSVFGL